MDRGQVFCANCGKTAGNVPMMPEKGRISGHIRLLGILWLANSAMRLLQGVAVLTIFNRHFGVLPPSAPGFLPILMELVGRALIIASVVGFVTAWGLLEKHTWARTLGIFCGGISLVEMPFGTALGVYTLWVLLPAKSELEYQQIARSAAA